MTLPELPACRAVAPIDRNFAATIARNVCRRISWDRSNRLRNARGLGAGLLKDAIVRVLAEAEGRGVRALLVHAKDDAAKAFYERYEFAPLPGYPMNLVLFLKDARRIVSG